MSRTMFREKLLLKRDLMLGKTFYSPNLTNLFFFSAPNIKISDQKWNFLGLSFKIKNKTEEIKSQKIENKN